MDEISPNCTRPVDIVGIFHIFCKISEEGGGTEILVCDFTLNPARSIQSL